MKKIITPIVILFISTMANAQQLDPMRGNAIKYEMVNTSRMLLTIFLFGGAILIFIKLLLDFSLKSKLIEKGAPDAVITQLLQPAGKDTGNSIVKWFAILAGAGIGLWIVYLFPPLGIHSLAIMSLSLSLSFLGYYFFIRRKQKQ